MNPKLLMRKKAMDQMMKEGPGIKLDIRRKQKPELEPMEGEHEAMEGQPEEEQQEAGKKGFEQMLVSPEEKEMILEMRGQKKGEKQPQEQPEEIQHSEEF